MGLPDYLLYGALAERFRFPEEGEFHVSDPGKGNVVRLPVNNIKIQELSELVKSMRIVYTNEPDDPVGYINNLVNWKLETDRNSDFVSIEFDIRRKRGIETIIVDTTFSKAFPENNIYKVYKTGKKRMIVRGYKNGIR